MHENIVSTHQLETPFVSTNIARAWFVVIIAATFFFYEFIQLNMFNSISTSLMQSFNINAAMLGKLSSFYFIANVIFARVRTYTIFFKRWMV